MPSRKQVEALIGGSEQRAVFERPPGWLGSRHGIEHFKARNYGRVEVACVRELLHAAFTADGHVHPGFRLCERQYRSIRCRARCGMHGLLGCHCTIL
jgi:hypothetical protein